MNTALTQKNIIFSNPSVLARVPKVQFRSCLLCAYKAHLSIVLQHVSQKYFDTCRWSPSTVTPFCMVAILSANAASYLHYSSHVHRPILPVCEVPMPSEAEQLGGVVSSGHLTANFLTNHRLLLHSEHSCQHPVVSQTALTVPHIPARFVTQISHSRISVILLHSAYIHTYIHTYIDTQTIYFKRKQRK
jgi:hypothetical protein